ncbi:MAG: TlpA disulfide reductase family protein [Candidatus Zhuqueibacterota bacterium]
MKWTSRIFVCWLTILVGSGLAQTTEPDERGYIVQVGQSVENFEVKLIDGQVKKLSEFNAPVLVLNFFASWCVVCRNEIPHLEKEVWQAMKEKGLVILGVDYKEAPAVADKFAKEMHITYPVALDTTGSIFERFARGGVTRNIVLDRNCTIIFLTRLFDPAEFNAMKKTIGLELQKNPQSTLTPPEVREKMDSLYLTDLAKSGKRIALEYQGAHPLHLEGSINAVGWRKMDVGISLFKGDVVSRHYDKKTRTLRIGYRHFSGVRIAILPMTSFSVPKGIERIVIFDEK